ncbi:hypothetical protein K0504_10155 [Neiella marina]|uniref:Uncharacterized protein n=1 Tax=Neiella holothuriorum TaxID=2870530 RepID=A0ABS7EGD4_9GAMM|nr:hypothetical protein [Neiella holothuriorum]MBW8191401.1 hypothetical protein [Neiella holothuriorum]
MFIKEEGLRCYDISPFLSAAWGRATMGLLVVCTCLTIWPACSHYLATGQVVPWFFFMPVSMLLLGSLFKVRLERREDLIRGVTMFAGIKLWHVFEFEIAAIDHATIVAVAGTLKNEYELAVGGKPLGFRVFSKSIDVVLLRINLALGFRAP